MSKKTALITGISGQDGAYLAQFLLSKKYKIIGTDRRSARGNNWRLNRLGILNKIIYEEMELGELYEIMDNTGGDCRPVGHRHCERSLNRSGDR